jgi:prepilin-type N-terminal cleavage/methylation domain-containing protein
MKKNTQHGLVLNGVEGFTLVELLIVVALLGALAVGLLASLDPFEQFKKGTDTGVRNTVSEIQGGVIRYYAIKNEMPWGTDTASNPTSLSGSVSLASMISAIVAIGELKTDFMTLAGGQLKDIYVTGTQQSVTVCFKPLSKSFRSDPNTKYVVSGTTASSSELSGCSANVTSDTFSCYWCVK